ncbi:MAG: type II secretion system protein [Wujia sp.]
MKKENHNKGFSLVELIIVIAIMAVLAGAVAPALIRYIDKARQGRFVSDAKTVLDDAMADFTEQFSKDDDEAIDWSQSSIGQINGVDCEKVNIAYRGQRLDLSNVTTPEDSAIFYVDPDNGSIVGCVFNDGRYTGYWTYPDGTGTWTLNKN